MTGRGEIQVLPNSAAVAQAVADLFLDVGETAMADRGVFRVALSGGNTPRVAYELLAQEPRRDMISWSDVYVYFGDERCVPPDDEQSNFRMASKAFLDRVPIPKKNVHRMAGEIALIFPEPDAPKAEACFERALAVARQQQAKSWELRAAMSMARMWRDQGKRQQAHDLLAPVYGWFTEGFDTLDWKDAKALLEQLKV